jgi:large conductance mechanosensitive channel
VRTFFREFRKFAMQGNLVQVAVAFVIGLYFKEVIDSMTNGILLAVVAAVFGKQNFSDIQFTLNGSRFLVGGFLNALINFVLVAFLLFLVVKGWEKMLERMRLAPDPDDLTPDQRLLTEIRDLLASRGEG